MHLAKGKSPPMELVSTDLPSLQEVDLSIIAYKKQCPTVFNHQRRLHTKADFYFGDIYSAEKNPV